MKEDSALAAVISPSGDHFKQREIATEKGGNITSGLFFRLVPSSPPPTPSILPLPSSLTLLPIVPVSSSIYNLLPLPFKS